MHDLPQRRQHDRRIAGRVAVLAFQGELTVVATGRRRGKAGVGGELVEHVAATGRVDQIGSDHRVEVEVERPLAGNRE